MPFVKLDTGILNSTLWVERECRELFITALLMAEPQEFLSENPQIAVRTLEYTGWKVPPGWYGFVPAAGVGIIRRAIMNQDLGMIALERLCSPDPESRSGEFDGRRMARIDGGYVVLNYMKYRERDYTAADRQRRYRLRKQGVLASETVTRNNGALHRNITQAEAEVEADIKSLKALAAQQAATAPKSKGEILEKLPLRGGGEFEIYASFISELEKIYPGVQVTDTLREMRGWCLGNPDRLKTRRGVKRFITRWLQNEQDKYDDQA